MKEIEYMYLLTLEDRKRHLHRVEKGQILGFMVQYEAFIQGKWIPIVRYDTAHGFAHKDVFKPDGKVKKIFLGVLDWADALTFADRDIDENWEKYKHQYLREL